MTQNCQREFMQAPLKYRLFQHALMQYNPFMRKNIA